MRDQERKTPSGMHPERYYSEYIHLATDEASASVILRKIIKERSSHGWKLMSAFKVAGGAALLLQWDTLESFSR